MTAANLCPADTAKALGDDITRHLSLTLGRDQYSINDRYRYTAVSLALRDRIVARWKATQQAYHESGCRRAYYMSLEFLMGRALGNAT